MSELHDGNPDGSDQPDPAANASQDTGHEADQIPDSADIPDTETVAEDEEPLTRGEYADMMREDTAAGETNTSGDTSDNQEEPRGAAGQPAGQTELAEPRTRQEVSQDTSTTEAIGDSQVENPNPDADLDAALAERQRLPEPRTRQEAAEDADPARPVLSEQVADQKGYPALTESETANDRGPDTAVAPDVRTSSDSNLKQAEPATAPERGLDQVSTDASRDSGAQKIVVQDEQGHGVPITVVHTSTESRTVGDDTPAGAGLKLSGEQLLHVEGDDPSESRADRFLGKAFERMDDVHDATSNIADAVQQDLPHGSGGQEPGHVSYMVHDQPTPPPDAPGFGDMVANITVVAVMATVGFRRLFGKHRKGK